jgi:hypothetical protein
MHAMDNSTVYFDRVVNYMSKMLLILIIGVIVINILHT